MRSRRFILVGVLVLLGTAAAACTSADSGATEADAGASTTATAEEDPAIVEAESDQPAMEEMEEAEEVEDPEVAAAEPDNDGLYPTVVDVTATPDGDAWRFNVTLLSEYDSPQRYADAWRVLDADDNELGIRVLTHDHANEQPFTRSHSVAVPEGTMVVYVEGRDQLNGWSGERFELDLTDIS